MNAFDVIYLLVKIVMLVWSGWNFMTNDKEKISTLWYGMFLITMLIN